VQQSLINDKKSIENIEWDEIIPDKNNDWINQRDPDYDEKYISLLGNELSVFKEKLTGINTSRDAWVYGFNKEKVKSYVDRMVKNYNYELERLKDVHDPEARLNDINRSGNYINWSRSLRDKFSKGESISV